MKKLLLFSFQLIFLLPLSAQIVSNGTWFVNPQLNNNPPTTGAVPGWATGNMPTNFVNASIVPNNCLAPQVGNITSFPCPVAANGALPIWNTIACPTNNIPVSAAFRRDFNYDPICTSMDMVQINADNLFRFFVNGNLVLSNQANSSCTGTPIAVNNPLTAGGFGNLSGNSWSTTFTFFVGQFLVPGNNTFAIEVINQTGGNPNYAFLSLDAPIIALSGSNNSYFPTPEFCVIDNELVITLTGNSNLTTQNWWIRLVDEGEDCTDFAPAELIHEIHTTNLTTTFTLPLPNPLSYEDIIGRCIVFQHGYTNECGIWREFRRAIEVPDLPNNGTNYSYFPTPEFCRVGDSLEITLTGNSNLTTQSWWIRLVHEGEDCKDFAPSQIIHEIITNDLQTTFILPLPGSLTYDDIIGRCLVFQHGYTNECGIWREFRRAIKVPNIPEVEALFGYMPSPPGTSNTLYTFTPVFSESSYSFPIYNVWTVSGSNSLGGPYNQFYFSTDEILSAYLSNNLYYLICHERRSTADDICTRDKDCDIICPVNDRDCGTSEERQAIIQEIINDDQKNYRSPTEIPMNKVNPNIETVIFPNPAQEEFNILNNSDLELKIEIYNTTGHLIQWANIESFSKRTFSTLDFNNGLYIVRKMDVYSGQLINTEKLIIAK